MADKVGKYTCEVCGRRHSNGWFCGQMVTALRSNLTVLRAEVEAGRILEKLAEMDKDMATTVAYTQAARDVAQARRATDAIGALGPPP